MVWYDGPCQDCRIFFGVTHEIIFEWNASKHQSKSSSRWIHAKKKHELWSNMVTTVRSFCQTLTIWWLSARKINFNWNDPFSQKVNHLQVMDFHGCHNHKTRLPGYELYRLVPFIISGCHPTNLAVKRHASALKIAPKAEPMTMQCHCCLPTTSPEKGEMFEPCFLPLPKNNLSGK